MNTIKGKNRLKPQPNYPVKQRRPYLHNNSTRSETYLFIQECQRPTFLHHVPNCLLCVVFFSFSFSTHRKYSIFGFLGSGTILCINICLSMLGSFKRHTYKYRYCSKIQRYLPSSASSYLFQIANEGII